MSDQLAIDFAAVELSTAVQMGRYGQRRALEHAEDQEPGFGAKAYAYLASWVYWRGVGEAFSAEDVVEQARELGVTAPDGRAWGAIFSKAARAGLIRRSSVVFKRKRGHGCATLGWERVR